MPIAESRDYSKFGITTVRDYIDREINAPEIDMELLHTINEKELQLNLKLGTEPASYSSSKSVGSSILILQMLYLSN